jgi:hypothetical protein
MNNFKDLEHSYYLANADVKRLQKVVEQSQSVAEVALARVEELEKEQSRPDQPIGGGEHVFTNEEIDAAWAVREDPTDLFTHTELTWLRNGIEAALNKLGIHRCEECDGDGLAPHTDPRSLNEDDPQLDRCPDCNGHRWKIGEPT